MTGISILVCEDERLFALELKERLARMGHRVVGLAASGPEAFEVASAQKPDLALMDVSLDGPMLGTAVADALNRDFGVPSIFVTAFADSETVSDAHRSHPLAYLVKPISDRELEMAIEFGMAQHTLREALRGELSNYKAMIGRGSGLPAWAQGDSSAEPGELSRVVTMMDELGGVVGHIAHHLNNSLAGVMGYLEWLKGCETLQDFERRYVQAALDQCEDQRTFVQRLLWASQEGPRQLVMVNVRELIEESLLMIRTILRPDLLIKVVHPTDDLIVFADRDALKNAVSGVIVNASEASAAGESIEIVTSREYVPHPPEGNDRAVPDSYAVLLVRDQGVGMSTEQIQEVCEPFVTTRENPKIAGLGLSVAYGVTRAHGGWVDIQSERGRGTVVRLFLPLVSSH